jgi:hypothetical protein
MVNNYEVKDKFFADLEARFEALPANSDFKSIVKKDILCRIDAQRKNYDLKKEEDYRAEQRLIQIRKENEENTCKSTDGITGRDFGGHYSNAWIDSGDGSWWIDENGNEHSH